jgi:hypothetical protein
MYRVLVVVLTGLLLVGLSFSAFAEEKGMMGCDMMKGGMMGKPAMSDSGMAGQGGMMGMCPMMKSAMNPMPMNHTMMNKSLVATADGGVVVLVGNKLMKYDKDLVLQEQVEIEMDMAGMQKAMMPMMQGCPMGGGMMGEMKGCPMGGMQGDMMGCRGMQGCSMGASMGCCGKMEFRGGDRKCMKGMKTECKRHEAPKKHGRQRCH